MTTQKSNGVDHGNQEKKSAQRTYPHKTIYEDFLRTQVSGHTHALTITLRNDSPTELLQNRRARLEETIRHLLYRISRKCFKNRHKRYGLRIGSTVVIENGSHQNRLHAHLTLKCPDGMPGGQFESTVLSAVTCCKSLGQQCVMKPITDSNGWAVYIAKDGLEAFSPQCTQHAKH
jgi:hypothetical protein